MKKIALLGDSIRLHYQQYVKDALAQVAEVYCPEENGRFALYTLRRVSDWKRLGKWDEDIDLVHWNVGLWDVVRMYGDDSLTLPADYEVTLARIDKRLRILFPKAKIIFGLTTAVLEEQFTPIFMRRNADIEKYNQIAIKTLSALGEEINDLYTLSKNAPEYCHSDGTHYGTKEGIKLLGDKIVEVICDKLNISPEKLVLDDVTVADIPKNILGA